MEAVRKPIGIICSLPNISTYFKQKLPGYDFKDIKITEAETSEEAFKKCLAEINSYDILVANARLLTPFIYDIHSVKWIQSTWAGNDFIMDRLIPGKKHPSFSLTKFAGFGRHLAEYVISNVINVERFAFQLYDLQKTGKWGKTASHQLLEGKYRLLSELSISILGVGDIGSEIAEFCKSFDMTVYGMVSQIPKCKQDFVDEYFTSEDLEMYLKKSDYVCNVLPKTKATDNMLSGGILKNCAERKSVFINVGRGNVINEISIVEAISNNWIKGAVLDVFEKEPLPENSLLWNLPGVIITPHCAGISLSHEVFGCFLENLKLYERGEELKYKVDFDKAY